MKTNRTLILLSAAVIALAACSRLEELTLSPVPGEDNGGRITFDVSFSIPVDETPATRAMDSPEIEIRNIYIAVFGSNNYLNEFVKAIPMNSNNEMSLDGNGNYLYEADANGKYKVRFALRADNSKHYVHILANVPEFSLPPVFGYADEVLGKNLYTSGNEDGYWQYKEFPNGIDANSDFNGLKLVRNYAKVNLDASQAQGLTVLGFELYDTPARGSFAPYKGKNAQGDFLFCTQWVTNGQPSPINTVLSDYGGYLIPGATPLNQPENPVFNNNPKFTYEHPKSEDNPTYIIAKVQKTGEASPLYYRLDLLDSRGIKIPLLRNYVYTISLLGIQTEGYLTPELAAEHPSDYNFTLSEDTQEAYEIFYNGAFMQTSYVEKVFTTEKQDVPFKYRYTDDIGANSVVYSSGTLSTIEGGGEITPDWSEGDSGVADSDGWYTVTYDVENPYQNGADEVESTFTVTAGEGNKMIRRLVRIISMKPKRLKVNSFGLNNGKLDLSIELPEGLHQSMFPLSLTFQTRDLDLAQNNQVWFPVNDGLLPASNLTDNGATIYFVKEVFWSDYDPDNHSTPCTLSLTFDKPNSESRPEVIIADKEGYFVPLTLGSTYATGLSANPIANGAGHQTTLDFYCSVANVPITLTLTNLQPVLNSPDNTVTISGTGPTYSFTPTQTGAHHIVLEAVTDYDEGTVQFTGPSTYMNPDVLTVHRYDTYVRGSLTQGSQLPLGTGETTTFSFDYSAPDLMAMTITATGVDVYTSDGLTKLNVQGNQFTYLPSAQGLQSFIIKTRDNFGDAGTITLDIPYMTNPAPLSVNRSTTFIIPTHAITFSGVSSFSNPIYWLTSNDTYVAVGSSSNFYESWGSGYNNGTISFDVSAFAREDNTPVYFAYNRSGLFVSGARYSTNQPTLLELFQARNADGQRVALTF